MMMITDREFQDFQRFIYEAAGINLSPAKKALVTGRLARRLSARNMDSYVAYFALLRDGKDSTEVQTAIDLLTTNETYFFRDKSPFQLLQHKIFPDLIDKRAKKNKGLKAFFLALFLFFF